MIDGREVLSNGELVTLDRDDVLARANAEAKRIAKQVG